MKTFLSIESIKNSLLLPSGGKNILDLKKIGALVASSLLLTSLLFSWLGPKKDLTSYRQVTWSQKVESTQEENQVSQMVINLLQNGKAKILKDMRDKSSRKRKKKVVILYNAPQIIGKDQRKSLPMGAKLLGVLTHPIDSRTPSLVKVRLVQTVSAYGMEIKRGSLFTGVFSVSDEKIFIAFKRLDLPNGEFKRIEAQALNATDYTPGITGNIHSSRTLKTAASLGLSMISGMADVLTEKESLGFAQNGVQAKSNMKNALLQGASRSAQDQASRFSSEIDDVEDYMTLPEGQELIIELTKELK